jgi:hypothetical protein
VYLNTPNNYDEINDENDDENDEIEVFNEDKTDTEPLKRRLTQRS